MRKRIFYSWQSDLPNSTNRGFISEALDKAISELKANKEFLMIPFLDRDTEGLAGSPDIAASIFDKIRNSSVFVCDVSIINLLEKPKRPSPNPNVLIELGFAIRHLDWSNIIMIMNLEYGNIEMLPFDLRSHRILTYKIKNDDEDKAVERNKVKTILKNGLKDILLGSERNKSIQTDLTKISQSISSEDSFLEKANSKLKAIMSITYIADRNESLEKEAEKLIENGKYNIAIDYITRISFVATRNGLLEKLAEKCISLGDFASAQNAISLISYIATRNDLYKKLVNSV